jgi:hypothetical protein
VRAGPGYAAMGGHSRFLLFACHSHACCEVRGFLVVCGGEMSNAELPSSVDTLSETFTASSYLSGQWRLPYGIPIDGGQYAMDRALL